MNPAASTSWSEGLQNKVRALSSGTQGPRGKAMSSISAPFTSLLAAVAGLGQRETLLWGKQWVLTAFFYSARRAVWQYLVSSSVNY